MSVRSTRSQSALTSGQPHRGDSHIDAPTVTSSPASRIINQPINNVADIEEQIADEIDNQNDIQEEQDKTHIGGENIDTSEAKDQETSQDNQTDETDPMERLASVFADALVKVSAKSGAVSLKSTTEYSKGPDARLPDKFDGSKADHLRPFLSQLNIVFLNHPKRFSTDRSKVLFAGSFLTGTAADWFEPIIDESSRESLMLDDWILFKDRLTKIFGDPNAVATAEYNLHSLEMKDSEGISEYITRFRTEAARLHWDDAALKYQFRNGLADRILDDLAHVPIQPATLSELMETTLALDNRYWERIRERRLRRRSAPTSRVNVFAANDKRSNFSLVPKSIIARGRAPGTSNFSQNKNSFPFKKSNSPFSNNKAKTPLDKVLINGRLKEDEKKRRADKGLCAYCGGPHNIDNCPAKPDSRPSVARQAITVIPARPVVQTKN